MKYIIVLLSIVFDIILLNIFDYNINNISIFYPMLTITSISYISNCYKLKNKNKYFLIVLIFSIIYDSLIINNLFVTIFLFLQIAQINICMMSLFTNSFIVNLLKILCSIILYDLIFYIILVVVNYYNFSFNILIYKISHSIILNLIYGSFLFFVLKPKKN